MSTSDNNPPLEFSFGVVGTATILTGVFWLFGWTGLPLYIICAPLFIMIAVMAVVSFVVGLRIDARRSLRKVPR